MTIHVTILTAGVCLQDLSPVHLGKEVQTTDRQNQNQFFWRL
jgi:hypothetical protein